MFLLGVLEDGVNYMVIVIGVVGDMDMFFDLAVNVNVRIEVEMMGMVDFNVYYGFINVFVVDVDVWIVGIFIFGLEYGNFMDYLFVELQIYYLDVCVVGNLDIVVIFEVDLSIFGGGVVIVFVFGLLGAMFEFGLFVVLFDGMVIELLLIEVVCVQFIYNVDNLIVDIYVNGGFFFFGFEYCIVIVFDFVLVGVVLDIVVVLVGGDLIIDNVYIGGFVMLVNGDIYVIFVLGDVIGGIVFFFLVVNVIVCEVVMDEDNIDILVLYGFYDVLGVDVDVCLIGNFIENLLYGNYFVDYILVGEDVYYLDI